MEQKSYINLHDAVKEYENCDNLQSVDFVLLPPEKIDALTDAEDILESNFNNINDINLMPVTCGVIEVFSYNQNRL